MTQDRGMRAILEALGRHKALLVAVPLALAVGAGSAFAVLSRTPTRVEVVGAAGELEAASPEESQTDSPPQEPSPSPSPSLSGTATPSSTTSSAPKTTTTPPPNATYAEPGNENSAWTVPSLRLSEAGLNDTDSENNPRDLYFILQGDGFQNNSSGPWTLARGTEIIAQGTWSCGELICGWREEIHHIKPRDDDGTYPYFTATAYSQDGKTLAWVKKKWGQGGGETESGP